jgi:thiamine biosynthesis lipoprotein
MVLASLAVASLSGACHAAENRGRLELRGPTMGTTWSITLVPGARALDRVERDAIDRDVRDLLVHIEGLVSTWDLASELSRFNRSRSTAPFPVSPDTFAMFRWAMALAAETAGALDVTVLPLVHAWGFGAGGDASAPAPDAATLTRLREATGIRHLELDPDGRWVRKLRTDVECDFSALAAGYAADRIAELLADRGLTGFLIDVGGEMVAQGHNAEGQLWSVAVERPDARGRHVARIVAVDNMAIATSGDYRNYRELDGQRLAHIIDPRTARPIRHALASATVIDSLGVRADALATALMVLGPEDGMALAHRLDLAALLLVRNGQGGFDERTTPRFEKLARNP